MATPKPYTDYTWTSQGPWVGKRCPYVSARKNNHGPCPHYSRWVATPLGEDPAVTGLIACGLHISMIIAEMVVEAEKPIIVQEIPQPTRRKHRI